MNALKTFFKSVLGFAKSEASSIVKDTVSESISSHFRFYKIIAIILVTNISLLVIASVIWLVK